MKYVLKPLGFVLDKGFRYVLPAILFILVMTYIAGCMDAMTYGMGF